MTDQNAPAWAVAANNAVATQLGALIIENASLNARVQAVSAGFDQLSAEHSKTLAELATAKAERDRAVAELTEIKAAPMPAAPAAVNT